MSRKSYVAAVFIIASAVTAVIGVPRSFGQHPGVIGPYKVAARDFTGDGITDLVLAFHDSGDVVLERGDGRGNFSLSSRSPLCAGGLSGSGSYNIATGDIDADGRLDVAIGCQDTFVVVGRNSESGFESTARFSTEGSAKGVNLRDLNGDSRLDLMYTSRSDPKEANLAGGQLYVRPGKGDGTFGDAITLEAGNSAYYVESADINGDGFPDLLVANEREGGVSYWLNPGGNLFAGSGMPMSRQTLRAKHGSINDVRVADVNGDGFTDIVAAALEGDVSIFLGHGDGTFAKEQVYDAGDSAAFLAVADFGLDGDMDFVVSHWKADYVSVFTNDGSGHFTRRDYRAGMGTYGLDSFDSNGNGFADIVVASYVEGTLTILRSDGCDGFGGPIVLRRAFNARPWRSPEYVGGETGPARDGRPWDPAPADNTCGPGRSPVKRVE